MAEVIRSLDEDMTHDQIIEEFMCCFSGIPSTAAAIDELSHMRQQPGENLHVYINSGRNFTGGALRSYLRMKTTR